MAETPTGHLKQPPNFVLLVMGTLGIVVFTLIVLRWVGYFPRPNSESKTKLRPENISRAYTPIGTVESKLFYFDQNDEKICEYENKQCKERGSIPSVEVSAISPDFKKVALLTTKELPKSGIYILDLSTPSPSFMPVAKTEWLPKGYQFYPTSTICWSQESKQIAFVAYKDLHADIFVVQISQDTTQSPSGTTTLDSRIQFEQQTKRIEPIRNPGEQVGGIIWRGEKSLIFVTELDGKDAMYEVAQDGGGITRLKPN